MTETEIEPKKQRKKKEAIGQIVSEEDLDLLDQVPKNLLDDPYKRRMLQSVMERLHSEKEPSDKLIQDMRGLGLKRPSKIPPHRWGDRDLPPTAQITCYMAAWGLNGAQIAEQLGISPSGISAQLKQPEVQARIREIQDQIWGRDPKRWIESILPQAIETAIEIMNDKNEKGSTRLQAATDFMDRALGKAQQKLEIEDSSLKKVLEKIDQMEILKRQGLVTDAEIVGPTALAAPVVEAGKPKNLEEKVDEWVAENLK